jgi:hypothetical protein
MAKRKGVRIAGFIVALCASGGLIAAATQSTGAYFTSTTNGTLSASTGHLTLSTTDTNLNFSNLVPGEYQTQNINYSVDASTNVDVWLVFPSGAGYDAFTGYADHANPSDGHPGGLGRYGHFAVSDDNNVRFRSYNLQDEIAGGSDQVCGVDANGDGGSDQQATSPTDTPPLCGVPQAIKLDSNVGNGGTGQIELTFGVTGKWTGQNLPVASVPYQVVATQVGVRPDALNF